MPDRLACRMIRNEVPRPGGPGGPGGPAGSALPGSRIAHPQSLRPLCRRPLEPLSNPTGQPPSTQSEMEPLRRCPSFVGNGFREEEREGIQGREEFFIAFEVEEGALELA
jgi:hypothetical protein